MFEEHNKVNCIDHWHNIELDRFVKAVDNSVNFEYLVDFYNPVLNFDNLVVDTLFYYLLKTWNLIIYKNAEYGLRVIDFLITEQKRN